MLKEFREFLVKGNMIEIAIGLLIAAAFGGVVTALTKDLINPIIGMFGKVDFANMMIVLKQGTVPGPYLTPKAAADVGAVVLLYGDFISVVINFIITAFVIFMILKAYKKFTQEPVPEEAAAPTTEEVLLAEIRDLLKASR